MPSWMGRQRLETRLNPFPYTSYPFASTEWSGRFYAPRHLLWNLIQVPGIFLRKSDMCSGHKWCGYDQD